MKRIILIILLSLVPWTLAAQENAYAGLTPDEILEIVFVKDQTARSQMDSLYAVGASVDELLPVITRVAMDDIENQDTALPLLDKYLSKEISLSDNSLRTLFYVIQHADYDVQAKYQDFIYDLYPMTIISGTEYAFFVDRLNVGQNKAQVYGCQVYMNGNANDRFFYPVKMDNDLRRHEVGLSDFYESVGNAFVGEYAPVFVSPGEYVIFGHIQAAGKDGNIVGVQAMIVFGKESIHTNSKGFYSIKFSDRDSIPARMRVVANGRKHSERIKVREGTDWQIIDVNL